MTSKAPGAESTDAAGGDRRTCGRRISLAASALAAVAGLVFLLTPLGAPLGDLSYDLGFLLKRARPSNEVVLVYMDWDSHVRLGQERFRRWDRGLHARLVDRLRELGAKAVVFDVVFLSSTDSPVADRELVDAVRTHGRVAVGAMVAPDVLAGEVIGWKLTKPFPELESVAGWGVVEVGAEDRSVRQHYFRRDFDAPSLAWRAAQLTMSGELPDPFRERWFNFQGPPGFLEHHAYWEVLTTNGVAANAFSNKVVFVGELYHIGMTGGKGTDDFRTPYTRWTGRRSPGVEVIATAYLNLVHGDWLNRLPVWAEILVVVLAAMALGAMLSGRRLRTVLGLGLAWGVVVTALAMVVVWQLRFWFPWLILVTVQLPCVVVWSLLAQARQGAGERERLVRQVAIAQAALANPLLSPPRGQSTGTAEATSELAPEIPDHKLVRCVGQGGYGRVWLALDAIGSYHAVKVVERRAFYGDQTPYEREFTGLCKFTPISRGHPGLVHVLQVGRRDEHGFMFYVMELADDEATGQKIDPAKYSPRTLAKDLARRGRLPLAECLDLGLQLVSALGYLHDRGLIHRDIKPANIIFVEGTPKLADIGLVTDLAKQPGGVTYLGTRWYIPPEGPGTVVGDLYSLGKVLYQAAVGLPVESFPELPTGFMERAHDDPLFEFNDIIVKTCANNPASRFASAADLHVALNALRSRILRQDKPLL